MEKFTESIRRPQIENLSTFFLQLLKPKKTILLKFFLFDALLHGKWYFGYLLGLAKIRSLPRWKTLLISISDPQNAKIGVHSFLQLLMFVA